MTTSPSRQTLLFFGITPLLWAVQVSVQAAPVTRVAVPRLSQAQRFNAVAATQIFGARYQFTTQPMLVEAAQVMLEMGASTIKFGLSADYFGPSSNIKDKDLTLTSLTQLARDEPAHRAVFEMPFANYVLWVTSFAAPKWQDGFSDAEARQEYREIYDLTAYLLKTYSRTGKSFYFGHWEGDWMLRPGYNRQKDPTPEALDGMTAWFQLRQKAIEDAKRDTPHVEVAVYQYAEVNLVREAMAGDTTLANDVLPRSGVDFVSYSCYDNLTGDFEAGLTKALDFLEAKLPPKRGIEGKRIFLGEYGFAGRNHTPQEQEAKTKRVLKTALQWGCPFAIYWELYNNEVDDQGHKGFWLIDDRGAKQPAYFAQQNFLKQSRQFVANFQKMQGREPNRVEWTAQALKWLE